MRLPGIQGDYIQLFKIKKDPQNKIANLTFRINFFKLINPLQEREQQI